MPVFTQSVSDVDVVDAALVVDVLHALRAQPCRRCVDARLPQWQFSACATCPCSTKRQTLAARPSGSDANNIPAKEIRCGVDSPNPIEGKRPALDGRPCIEEFIRCPGQTTSDALP
jgi:hypothetical protein